MCEYDAILNSWINVKRGIWLAWGSYILVISLNWAAKIRGGFLGVETARGCGSRGQRHRKGAICFGEDSRVPVVHIQKLRINSALKRSV